MQEMDVRNHLLDFLKVQGCTETFDEAVIEYAYGVLISCIEDEGEHDDELQNLDSLLAGACGDQYEATPEQERHERLLAIVQQARSSKQALSCSAPDVQLNRITAKPAHGSRGLNDSNGAGRGASTCLERENLSPAGDVAEPRIPPAVVQELVALCSAAVSEQFLVHALERRFQGDVQALAAWLLDCGRQELQAAEAAWQELHEGQMREQEEAQLLKERNKQQILEKFDLRPVPQPKDPRKAGKAGPPLDMWVSKQVQQVQHKVRYLDGRVVTTKGEKFVIEKAGEEWDGGSRGKVYTKGKRGKGFV